MNDLSKDHTIENPSYVKAWLKEDVKVTCFLEDGSPIPMILQAGPLTLAFKTDLNRNVIGPWEPQARN